METVGSLFSGAGLLDLGLERVGLRVVWHAEKESAPSAVLRDHWPDVPNLGDVKTVLWERVERPDLMAGGFPCPPFSAAGRKLGRDDPRYLWPSFAAAIRVVRPRAILLENVPALVTADGGSIFGEILGDLAEAGYVGKWACLRASDVGAPHRRERVFIAAYAVGTGVDADGGLPSGMSGSGDRSGRASLPTGSQVVRSADALAGGPDASPDAASSRRRRGKAAPDRVDHPDGVQGGRQAGPRQSSGRDQSASDSGREGPQGRDLAGERGPAHEGSGRRRSVGPTERGDVGRPGPGSGALADPDGGGRGPGSGLCADGSGRRGGRRSGHGDGEVDQGSSPERGSALTDADGNGQARESELDGGAEIRLYGTPWRHSDGRGDDHRWGPYAAAIERWEWVTGERAPDPLDDRGRLNVDLSRWMMGAPPGWHGDLPRTSSLSCYGNGVVVQVATVAAEWLLEGMPG